MNLKDFVLMSRYFKQVVTFDFHDDNTRDAFEKLITDMGFEQADDQSTWVLPFKEKILHGVVEGRIRKWSEDEDVEITETDFVQLFYAKAVKDENDMNRAGIASTYFKFNKSKSSLQ
jgi:hypothetical protein